MKNIIMAVCLIAGPVVPVWAAGNVQDQAKQAPAAVPAEEKTAQLVEVGNKICPVSHEEIGEHGMEPRKVTYKGKVYNLCCSMCEVDFNKDPEKYSKIAEEEVKEVKEEHHI